MDMPTFADRIATRFGTDEPGGDTRSAVLPRQSRGGPDRLCCCAGGQGDTSDATVVRAAKALGFSGLEDLWRTLADERRSPLSSCRTVENTLGEVGDDLFAAFAMTLDIHLRSLEALRH